jgi:signal transduction histidine kinase
MAFSIVQRHGGRIEVTSAPGEGTSFRVWVPVAGPAP